MLSGFEVFVHDVIAAITIDPWLNVYSTPLKLKFYFAVDFS